MGVTTTNNKPLNPRGNDQSPLAYNRAKLYSGKALDFDGVNDNIIVNGVDSVFDYGNAYTMAGYFKIVDGGSGGLMGNSNGNAFANLLGFVYKSGDDSNFYPDGSSSNFVTIYSGNTTDFVYIVCTSDGTTAKAYLNGQLVGSTSVSSYTNTGSRFNVGSSYSGNFGEHEAAGVKVFNTALTAAQVADLYNNPEKIVPTGVDNTALKLFLPMQEGAGTTAYDGSGNGNHGTISGATYVHGIGAPVAQTAVIDWNKGTNNQAYSEIANNAQWSKENLTITSDVINAPNGTLTADKMVASAVNTFHFSGQAQSLPNAKNYTASIYAKAAEYEHLYICLRTDTNSNRYGVKFDLVNGTYVDDAGLGSPTQTGYDITSVGDGWYRCEVTSYHTSGDVNGLYGPSPGGAVNGINNTFTGNGTDGIYIWGAQVNEGTTAGIYTPTIGTLQSSDVLLPQGLTSGRDITGVNLFENVRKQGALNLDGNSWAEVHDNASLDMTTNITAEAWVYWRQTTGSNDSGILARWNNSTGRQFSIYHATGSVVQFYTIDSQSSYSSMTEGWHHIVGTYDGANRKLYVDGVLRDTDAFTSAMESSDDPVEIGRYRHSILTATDDIIAQPRIYNRALTAEEVLQNYNSGKSIYK